MRLVKQGKSVISIHAPPRGATVNFIRHNLCEYISIHAPPRGATSAKIAMYCRDIFQFTPLREGRHARRVCEAGELISIHAPPRGATEDIEELSDEEIDFNSRPSARGDATEIIRNLDMVCISIHAPPRGATERMRFRRG